MNSALSVPATASLDDPFYYLTNFRFVLAWVNDRHHDLLGEPERAFLSAFRALPHASQALLARMVMRKGEHFRTGKLVYAEIGDTGQALAPLVKAGLAERDPMLTAAELGHHLLLSELKQALAFDIRAAGLGASPAKKVLLEHLVPTLSAVKPLSEWWPDAPDTLVRLSVMETCDRLRLMFFGNLRQDWAEFVLTELGRQRFEPVALSPDARAFARRDEVTTYLYLHRLRERLSDGEPPAALFNEVPKASGNRWLDARRSRLLVSMGREAERSGDETLSLTLYEAASGSDARIRQLRLLERRGEDRRALELARTALEGGPRESERQALERLIPRLERRLGGPPVKRGQGAAVAVKTLTLLGPRPVERAVAEHLSRPNAPVYYVENSLITGLFGLLLWPALFKPLPGAFFHPFHSAPADLYREDFVEARREEIDACLARLDDGRHVQGIRDVFADKHGTASAFIHWPALDETLLETALTCIPGKHLRALFERLLEDLKHNRAGFPDLIQFFPEADGGPGYRMIEVKGPGDRLQDNQRRWLAHFQRHAIPVEVCHVRWQATP
ncbi:VRR-NUC domain-containing protein [Halomonas sp. GD1P12]|uniref:VRR-NUC domain-containing protein n=1 Tax=Halomonas sp. GD1P12 TaxID=2982691 RepID=UPI0021E4C4DB|nr:VRR-NUC domain-containing protein [Halomonas sp. GD1P12]UYG00206.1 VRR-NUC domain-containing protein [Halomonas sp. GD1P12]